MIHSWDRRTEGSTDWNAIAITIRYYPWRGERRHCDPLCVSCTRLLDRLTREEEREREWKEGIRETEGRIPSFTLHDWPRRDSVPKIRWLDFESKMQTRRRRISIDKKSTRRISNDCEWKRVLEPWWKFHRTVSIGKNRIGEGETRGRKRGRGDE